MAVRQKGRALALLLGTVASMGLSGCMGQMGLSSMVTKGNLSVVDNRYGRAGVFVLLSPVYGLAATADLFVFNTIEFWSGTNPIEAGTKTVTSDNERYLVAWDNTGYKITNETTGEETRFNFDADTNSWALATPEGDITILTFIDDTHVKVPTLDGSSTIVELSDNGVLAYKDLVGYNNVLLAKK